MFEEEQDDLKLPPGATLVSAGEGEQKLPPGATLVHGKFPSTAVTPATRSAAEHTAPGTGTDLASRGRQIIDVPSPYTTPLVSGRTMLNQITHPLSVPSRMRVSPGEALLPEPDYSDATSVFDVGGTHYNADTFSDWRKSPSFLKQAATSTADVGAGFTSPASLTMAGAGGATAVAPELGVVTKPLMGAAGLGFGISGGKDIYDVTAGEEKNRPLADRLEKGLMGGAQVLGGAAGLGDTSLRGSFNRGMDIAPPNEPFTPRQLYDTAHAHGINLDLADATGRPIAKVAKQGTMYGLAGSGPFERNLTQNIGKLDEWGGDFLDRLSPRTGEAAGARIQEALRQDYEQRKAGASAEFEDLDKRVGPNSIDGTATVEAEAVKIRDGMKGYYDRHPELIPRQAWKIVNDLAARPTVDVNGVATPTQAHMFSWSELHQLRTDLMDIYRNNPEMIKSREQAWLQQMVKTIDDTMTGAASKLTPADEAQFRQANEAWEGLKSTYDNPAHPLYHAVRAQFPSKVAGSLLQNGTPEFARQLRVLLGPEFGDLQRAAAESILGQDRAGAGYDFKGMPGRVAKLKQPYFADLFGRAGDELRQMSKIGSTVTRDYNPSGSAKVGVKAGQIGGLVSGVGTVPTAAWLTAERLGSRAMNSPRITRFLTDADRARALPRGLVIAAPAASAHDDFDERARELMERLNRDRFQMAGPR